MSKPIVLKTRHKLGVDGVKQSITERYEHLKKTVQLDKVGESHLRWEGDTAHVSAKALGQRATATIDVTEADLTITILLPLVLMPFKGAIVAFLEKNEDAVKATKTRAGPTSPDKSGT